MFQMEAKPQRVDSFNSWQLVPTSSSASNHAPIEILQWTTTTTTWAPLEQPLPSTALAVGVTYTPCKTADWFMSSSVKGSGVGMEIKKYAYPAVCPSNNSKGKPCLMPTTS